MTLLSCSMPSMAMTVQELAAQFEAYKKQQAEKFEQLSHENALLKEQNQDLKTILQSTQQQVSSNADAVEVISENIEENENSSDIFANTTLGGYGELHYQNRSQENGEHKEEVDFHRFVLFFGHEFSENLRFFSELELEHSIAGDGKNGEIELEQAFIEYDINQQANAKAGLFIIPVGILNETHEPDTFYGVERNEVEKQIIPTTWWEAGIAGSYRFANGFSVDAFLTSGLDIDSSGSKAFSIRSGRGKVSNQTANDPIIGFRTKYTGIPGTELAATILHQTDLGQSDNPSGDSIDVGSGTLYETHAIFNHAIGPGIFSAKALYSRWEINVNDDAQLAAESQQGWYIEPSYRMPLQIGDIGIYGRYQDLKYYSGSEKDFDIWEGGANWWLHEHVVLKATYIYKEDNLNEQDERGFDLGIGYQF